jgi:hypothetical protein
LLQNGYGTATQILAPSKENNPPTLTVKLESTRFWPGAGATWLASTQGGVPAGTGGTRKFT